MRISIRHIIFCMITRRVLLGSRWYIGTYSAAFCTRRRTIKICTLTRAPLGWATSLTRAPYNFQQSFRSYFFVCHYWNEVSTRQLPAPVCRFLSYFLSMSVPGDRTWRNIWSDSGIKFRAFSILISSEVG